MAKKTKAPDYEQEIRQRITKRYENRTQFYGHLIGFIAVNGFLWGVLQPSGFGSTLSILITGGWTLGILIHFVNFLFTESRENAIEKAIERERQWRGERGDVVVVPEAEMKRKRERLSDLADDGELIEIVEDEEEQRYKRR